MRLRRERDDPATPVDLPGRSEAVIVSTANGGRMPARVLSVGPDGLVLAIVVPIKPFSARDLDGMVLLYTNSHGRIRLSGDFGVPDPSEPDVLQLHTPRTIEVLQERQYVRIRAARPLILRRAEDHLGVRSQTVDFSGGGALVDGPNTLKPGDEVEFRLTLHEGGAPVTGTARVVRVDIEGRRAIAFEQISSFDRRRLVRFIFEYQRDERRRGLSGGGSHGR